MDLVGTIISKINIFKGYHSTVVSGNIDATLETQDQAVIGTFGVVNGRYDLIRIVCGISESGYFKFQFGDHFDVV